MLRDLPLPDGDPDIDVQRSAKHRICRVYVFHNGAYPPTLRPSSFTVNWKSNPLTNSWTDGEGGRRGGKRAFSHETTILPWYRLAISYRCCDESFAFRRGEEIPEFLRDKGKQRPRMVSLFRFENSFTKEEERNGRENVERTWNVVLLTIHDREIFIFSVELGMVTFEIEGNFKMRRVKLQGKRIERERKGTI